MANTQNKNWRPQAKSPYDFPKNGYFLKVKIIGFDNEQEVKSMIDRFNTFIKELDSNYWISINEKNCILCHSLEKKELMSIQGLANKICMDGNNGYLSIVSNITNFVPN